ncbi:MAG TPA: AAA family ATPase [bacterium]|jgi:dephospho-CoA kinase|nr:AAA family ATPase [bacterium]HPO11242.1 AAA family ATPase [bacterium]HQL11432.1 AAA family ATPase [bacterium]
MDRIIIGIAGKIAAGKDTAANYLINQYGAQQLKLSKVLRDILQRIYKDISRENMQKMSTMLRNTFGDDLLANVIYNDILNSNEKMIVIDGVRRLTDIEILRSLPEFKLLFIDTDIENRYQRLIQRNENIDDRNKTFDDFQKEDQAEAEINIDKLKSIADYIIDNNGNIDNLYKQIDKIITELK